MIITLMEDHHPLLEELLQICFTHNLSPAKAHLVFKCYLELCEVRKLYELEYHFNEYLKVFYISGKKETSDNADIYIPVILQETINLNEIERLQELLSPCKTKFYLFIKDRDSTSTCYLITKGLVKPSSPSSSKKKKDLELNKYHFKKNLQLNKKKLYMKALKEK